MCINFFKPVYSQFLDLKKYSRARIHRAGWVGECLTCVGTAAPPASSPPASVGGSCGRFPPPPVLSSVVSASEPAHHAVIHPHQCELDHITDGIGRHFNLLKFNVCQLLYRLFTFYMVEYEVLSRIFRTQNYCIWHWMIAWVHVQLFLIQYFLHWQKLPLVVSDIWVAIHTVFPMRSPAEMLILIRLPPNGYFLVVTGIPEDS